MIFIGRLLVFFMLLIIVFLSSGSLCFGQVAEDSEKGRLIAASQSGASPLFFQIKQSGESQIKLGNFSHQRETIVRSGLPNYFAKVRANQPVTVAYIGGSITKANEMYREQSAGFIKNLDPGAPIKFINAGVSGSDTDLGVFRLYDHILQHNPDLIFIEFAVNGGFMEGMEGMIRQIWKHNPQTDVCLIYTVTSAQLTEYIDEEMPEGIKNLELLAAHYQVPSVHMGLEASVLEKDGKLMAKGNPDIVKDKIVFSRDGVHPLKVGGNLYASAIGRAMIKMRNNDMPVLHKLPKPFLQENWENAGMYSPMQIASFSEGWLPVKTSDSPPLNKFAEWFSYVMKTEVPGASFTFKFKGSTIGLFDIGGPESGQLKVLIDGKEVKLLQVNKSRALQAVPAQKGDFINRFNAFCNNRYRGQYILVNVEDGLHTVTFTVSSEIPDKVKILGKNQLEDITLFPEKYNQTVMYLGKILVRGEILKNSAGL